MSPVPNNKNNNNNHKPTMTTKGSPYRRPCTHEMAIWDTLHQRTLIVHSRCRIYWHLAAEFEIMVLCFVTVLLIGSFLCRIVGSEDGVCTGIETWVRGIFSGGGVHSLTETDWVIRNFRNVCFEFWFVYIHIWVWWPIRSETRTGACAKFGRQTFIFEQTSINYNTHLILTSISGTHADKPIN